MVHSSKVAHVTLVGLCALVALSGCSVVVGAVLDGNGADGGVATTCVSDPECTDTNACTDDRCIGNLCVRAPAFDGMPCEMGGMCSSGVCRPCPIGGCIDRCAGIACSGGQTCIDGECRDICIPPCSPPQTCMGNMCVDGPTPCGNLVIDMGEECDPPDGAECLPNCRRVCSTDLQCDDVDDCTTDKCDLPSSSCTHYPTDLDGDGYFPTVCAGNDCKDTDPSIHPDGIEICNTEDDDCDGMTDEDISSVTWFADRDSDGFGTSSFTTGSSGCTFPTGFVANSLDCYDSNIAARPYAPGEIPGFYGADRGDGSFDYDCDGVETPEVGYLACVAGGASGCPTGRSSCGGAEGTLAAPVCGVLAEVFACNTCTDAGGECQWSATRTISYLGCQ